MRHRLNTVTAPDGRALGVAQWGAADGVPVFFLHGTPGSRLARPDEAALAAAGLRVVTYDRPGYGASDRRPGRRVVDCAQDVAAIADALGIDRFAVSGWSGGGPHALAVAARLADRVTAVECQASLAPYDAEGLDWWADMGPETTREFGWALEGEQVLHDNLLRQAEHDLVRLARERAGVPAADRDAPAVSDDERAFVAAMHGAYTAGVWGRVDDALSCLQGWGYSFDEIAVPVTVRYGARDARISARHSAWLGTRIPNAKVVVNPDGGHDIDPGTQIEDLRTLVAAG
ncbi:alpha/beta fold hydrolase [Jatrophihabitans sp.]|uniref:alpha/beta fold hydrolase n=1 Tax=Jatrophihabitans sp. TaxID=1932789 RepID=UPI002B5E6357|nr:alpha/beta fold hydrolase [Jatrophihabitans sp.]